MVLSCPPVSKVSCWNSFSSTALSSKETNNSYFSAILLFLRKLFSWGNPTPQHVSPPSVLSFLHSTTASPQFTSWIIKFIYQTAFSSASNTAPVFFITMLIAFWSTWKKQKSKVMVQGFGWTAIHDYYFLTQKDVLGLARWEKIY